MMRWNCDGLGWKEELEEGTDPTAICGKDNVARSDERAELGTLERSSLNDNDNDHDTSFSI